MNAPLLRTGLTALVVAATLAPTTARADFRAEDYRADAELVARIASGLGKSMINRTRQAIAIGPHAGGFAGTSLSPSDGFGAITFGLGLYTFHVPGIFDLQEIVTGRLEARVKQRIAEIVKTSGQAPADLAGLALQVAEDVKAELMGELGAPPLVPRPRLGVVVEGVKLVAADGWQGRLGASWGVTKHASLGLGVGVQRAGGTTTALVGAELGVRLTPTGTLRTPVFDLFTRFDLGLQDGDDAELLVFGVRALLDVL